MAQVNVEAAFSLHVVSVPVLIRKKLDKFT